MVSTSKSLSLVSISIVFTLNNDLVGAALTLVVVTTEAWNWKEWLTARLAARWLRCNLAARSRDSPALVRVTWPADERPPRAAELGNLRLTNWTTSFAGHLNGSSAAATVKLFPLFVCCQISTYLPSSFKICTFTSTKIAMLLLGHSENDPKVCSNKGCISMYFQNKGDIYKTGRNAISCEGH